MEILIDAELVRRVLAEEREAARCDLESVGPRAALERSQQRHDARLAAAPDIGSLDCRDGCAWCCHFSVDVRAVEVLGILDFVAGRFTADEQRRLRSAVEANALTLGGLDELGRMRSNLPCPFLVDSRCSIYPVRPQTCRNYHATDVTGCRRSFENPQDLDIDPDFAAGVYQVGGAHVEAFSDAMQERGFDVDAYELNAALALALSGNLRFVPGASAFATLQGTEVPPEFDDD